MLLLFLLEKEKDDTARSLGRVSPRPLKIARPQEERRAKQVHGRASQSLGDNADHCARYGVSGFLCQHPCEVQSRDSEGTDGFQHGVEPSTPVRR